MVSQLRSFTSLQEGLMMPYSLYSPSFLAWATTASLRAVNSPNTWPCISTGTASRRLSSRLMLPSGTCSGVVELMSACVWSGSRYRGPVLLAMQV